MARQSYVVDGTGVSLSGDSSRLIERILRDSPGGIGRRMQSQAQEVADSAESVVPVRTGALRDSIAVQTKVGSTVITSGVSFGGSKATYAYYVKGARDRMTPSWRRRGPPRPPSKFPGKSVWQEAIRKPFLARTRDVAREGTVEIVQAAVRGGER